MAENEPTENQTPEDQQSGSSSTEEPNTVDLADEAGSAAVNKTEPKAKTRSLEELDLTDAQKASVESIVNKAVNDAVAKHDRRVQRKQEADGVMTRDQVEQLLAQKDAENARRVEARERFLSVLGEHGITPGTDNYKAVERAYRDGIESEEITPQILTTDAGIHTLVAIAGVSRKAASAAGPQGGMERKAPEGAILHEDGSTQLNVKAKGDTTLSPRERMNAAMVETLRNQS